MAYECTLAMVVDRVKTVYGRMTPEIRSRLTGDINRWVDRLCRRWNFWFLDVPAGQYAQTLFPVSDVDSDITYPVTNSRWFDGGWLAARAGQHSYLFMYPTVLALDITDTVSPVQLGEYWQYAEIKRINSCARISDNGTFDGELEVIPYDEFRRFTDYNNNQSPTRVSFQTQGGYSTVLFNTKPTQTELYQFDVRLASLPPLDKPHSSHAMLQYWPDAVIYAGLIEAAKYYGETRELQTYYSMLYGPEYMQTSNPNLVPGGVIGEMIAETRNRAQASKTPTMKVWRSATLALGRGGIRRDTNPYANYDQT